MNLSDLSNKKSGKKQPLDISSFKHIRLYLTERCNQACPSCFNATSRKASAEMDIRKLAYVLAALRKWGFKKAAVMGGEPLLHENFYEAYQIVQKKFPSVSLFTNGTIPFQPFMRTRAKDGVAFNASFGHEKVFQKNIEFLLREDQECSISFEIVVSSNANPAKIKERIEVISEILQSRKGKKRRGRFNFTFDCTENILAYREQLNEMMVDLLCFASLRGMNVGYDHSVPYCFLGSKLKILSKKNHIFNSSWCSIKTAGLIDAGFNIRYCAVYPRLLGNMFHKNGNIVTAGEFLRMVDDAYKSKLIETNKRLCRGCKEWLIGCNGACYPNASFPGKV